LIVDAIDRHQCTNMFASPALLDRVGRFGVERGVKLASLRRVISAGAPVRPDILERFAAMLDPKAEIFTGYGATEALPVAAIGHREILEDTQRRTAQGAGTCVGRPIEGVAVRVIRIDDYPIEEWDEAMVVPPGQIGEIAVNGPVVTREYFDKPDATALAKIREHDASIWHRMGDVGYFDNDGRLWFCGRKSQRVQTEHGTFFTDPIEAIFNQHPRVRRTALVGVGTPPRQRPVVCAELEPDVRRGEKPGILIELRATAEANALTRDARDFLFHKRFPVDIRHNAKIFREKLAAWAARRIC